MSAEDFDSDTPGTQDERRPGTIPDAREPGAMPEIPAPGTPRPERRPGTIGRDDEQKAEGEGEARPQTRERFD